MKKTINIFLCLSLIISFGCTSDDEQEAMSYSYQSKKEQLLSKIKKSQTVLNSESRGNIDYTIEEKQAMLSLSIQLLNSQGISNEIIEDEFENLENPKIVLTALAVSRIIDETALGNHIIDYETGFNYSTNSYVNIDGNRSGSIVDCALGALGVPAGLIVGAAGSTSTKALLKAARKLATRALGWVGAAYAIYDFGSCMEWW